MNIELDDHQAQVFLLLMKAGAFDIRGGSITIFFNEEGQAMKTRQELYTVA